MQKIFIRYFVVLMVITVGLTLLGNFALQTAFSQRQAEQDAAEMMTEISERIQSNQAVIDSLMVSLNDNYITRARALAEIIAQDPSVLESFDEMDRLAKVLNVDEVHVTDEKGILRWGNVQAYYGMDFASTDQTRPFLAGLTDKSFEMAQEPQPNGNEGKLFQYISIARQDKPGVVQVGVVPQVLDSALANNKIDVVIANYNVDDGVNVTALDKNTGIVVGDSKKNLIGSHYSDLGISDVYFQQQKTNGWIDSRGGRLYASFGQVGDYLVEVSFTENRLFQERQSQNTVAAVSSILLGVTIIVAIFILLKRKIINDMEAVNRDLREITQGNLDVVVDVKSTPEALALSAGINEMVGSLRQQMEEIGHQAADLAESNHSILSSLKYAKKIQHNLLPSTKAFDETFADYCVLWEPRDVVGGDIYWMKNFTPGAVLCVCDCTGHGTPGALLTMIVATALDAIVNDSICSDTAAILWELEQRLVSTLNVSGEKLGGADINDGADISLLFLSKSGEITLSSAKLHLFICDGKTVENIRGQKLSIGDGTVSGKEQINTMTIPGHSGYAYYIVSDGLFEQVGCDNHVPYGYSRFKQIILENHGRSQEEITSAIWSAFETYMGDEIRRDDVTLVSFKL